MISTAVLAQNWFFRFIDEMKEWNVELFGFEQLKNLRINTNKPRTRISVGSGIDWFETSVELVFGDQACSTGAEQDYRQTTELASKFVRLFGFGDRISVTDVTVDRDEHVNTDMEPSNAAIEALLRDEYTRTEALLIRHRNALTALVQALLSRGMLTPAEVRDVLLPHRIHLEPGSETGTESQVLEPYARKLAAFCESVELPAKTTPSAPGCLSSTPGPLTPPSAL